MLGKTSQFCGVILKTGKTTKNFKGAANMWKWKRKYILEGLSIGLLHASKRVLGSHTNHDK